MVFSFIFIVVGSQLENPLRVYLAAVVDKVIIALDDLVIDNPFRIDHR
jgi:hypothetical protein